MPESRDVRHTRPTVSRISLTPSVLLVDAHEHAENLLTACGREGVRLLVELAPDGREAWDLLNARGAYAGREQRPALLVLCRPERAESLDFLRRVRGAALLRHMPAALLTPKARPCPVTEAAGLAPVLYLAKPETAQGYSTLAHDLAGLLPDV